MYAATNARTHVPTCAYNIHTHTQALEKRTAELQAKLAVNIDLTATASAVAAAKIPVVTSTPKYRDRAKERRKIHNQVWACFTQIRSTKIGQSSKHQPANKCARNPNHYTARVYNANFVSANKRSLTPCLLPLAMCPCAG